MDNSQLVKEISEQIESLRDSIGWAHDNINECQTNIVHLEESKVSRLQLFWSPQLVLLFALWIHLQILSNWSQII